MTWRVDAACRRAMPSRSAAPTGDAAVSFSPHDTSLLVTGRSGSGKSTAAKAVLEQLAEKQYSFCVIDPEGDYLDSPQAVVVGTQKNPLSLDEVAQALATGNNIVFNLLGVALEERPSFFAAMVPLIEHRRLRTGQPHTLLIDEAHHMLGHDLPAAIQTLGASLDRLIVVTVHPELLCPPVLQRINGLIVVGGEADAVARQFAKASGRDWPSLEQWISSRARHWSGSRPAPPRCSA